MPEGVRTGYHTGPDTVFMVVHYEDSMVIGEDVLSVALEEFVEVDCRVVNTVKEMV